MPYLASKNDDLVDDPGSLVLQELLDDVLTDGASPNNCEGFVSGHEPMLQQCLSLLNLSSLSPRGVVHLFQDSPRLRRRSPRRGRVTPDRNSVPPYLLLSNSRVNQICHQNMTVKICNIATILRVLAPGKMHVSWEKRMNGST